MSSFELEIRTVLVSWRVALEPGGSDTEGVYRDAVSQRALELLAVVESSYADESSDPDSRRPLDEARAEISDSD